MENGASVCEVHHLECESTVISVEQVREAAGITVIIVPEHLYRDQKYDKWGNPVLPNGARCKGELFNNESVQKILKIGGVLGVFTNWVKYPRTYHVPWTGNFTKDDKVETSLDHLQGKRVIVTEKMDGENTTMYSDHIHARSVDSSTHEAMHWVKNFWSQRMGDIPIGWRVCGENLHAKHAIEYDDLPSFFMGFSMWDEKNMCMSWDDTIEWFELFDISPVPVLYDDVFDAQAIKQLSLDYDICEGYVLRNADSFHYTEFKKNVYKYVREGHVATVQHWRIGQRVEYNKMI